MSPRRLGGYPSKKRLTEAEALHDIQHGPKIEWFEPWAERVIDLRKSSSPFAYGYVHVYMADGAFRVDSASWPDEDGLRWGLNGLWHEHGGHTFEDANRTSPCDNCLGVKYFIADEPPRLYGVLEGPGEGLKNPEWTSITRPIGQPRAGEEVE